MNNLILVVICLLIGLVLQRSRHLPDNFAISLNAYVIYVALPALVLCEIPHLTLNTKALLPIIFAWVLMTLSALLVWVFTKRMGWSREVTGALMLTVPLGNTSFIGLPLIDALLGQDAIPYALLYDQFGSFIALSTYGNFIAAFYSRHSSADIIDLKSSIFASLKIMVRFPAFIAVFVALMTMPLSMPSWLVDTLQRISVTLVPVVMVAVGLQWRLRLALDVLSPLLFGLIISLVLTPLFAFCCLKMLGDNSLAGKVVVLEAAMPAMISSGVLAVNYQLAPRLASSLVGYGLLLSFVSVWMWRQFI